MNQQFGIPIPGPAVMYCVSVLKQNHKQTRPWSESPSAPRSSLVAVSEDQGSVHCQSSFPHTLTGGGERQKSKGKASKLHCGICTPSSLGQPKYRSPTHLCIYLDGPRPGLGLCTWLSGTHTWTHRTCHQRHRWAWAESWGSGGCTEGHGHLLETASGKKKKSEIAQG